jgi:hypothetical protein
VKAASVLRAGAVALALAVPAAASAQTDGDAAATLRAAAGRLISAELSANGAGVCGVLNAPLTATVDGRTCAQRWDARSRAVLASPARARGLRADLRALVSAPVTIDGEHGQITLPRPLLGGHSRFYWTANCWMLTS